MFKIYSLMGFLPSRLITNERESETGNIESRFDSIVGNQEIHSISKSRSNGIWNSKHSLDVMAVTSTDKNRNKNSISV